MGANAQTSVPAFTAGQVLTAAQMTQVNTGIPVFADSTARDAAFGGAGEKTLAEGQMAYLEDTNATQYYDGSSWAAIAGGKILQVVSTTKTDTFSTTSTSYTDVTGLSVTITPTSATSNILVMYDVATSPSTVTNGLAFQMVRDSTAIGGGTAAGSRISASKSMRQSSGYVNAVSGSHLDSPATTSATTYKVQMIVESGMTGYVNRSSADTNSTNPTHARTSSTITVLEVSA